MLFCRGRRRFAAAGLALRAAGAVAPAAMASQPVASPAELSAQCAAPFVLDYGSIIPSTLILSCHPGLLSRLAAEAPPRTFPRFRCLRHVVEGRRPLHATRRTRLPWLGCQPRTCAGRSFSWTPPRGNWTLDASVGRWRNDAGHSGRPPASQPWLQRCRRRRSRAS